MLLIAIILGLVEGATEFLPVSSTGHLILVGELLGFTGDKAATFEIFIQLGAILAVVWTYFGRLKGLLKLQSNDGFEGKRGLTLLLLTTIPAVIAGLLLHVFIKDHLFNPVTVALGLLVGGIAILVIEHRKMPIRTKNLETITPTQALSIGIIQTISLFPGVSRAGATILGGMGVGFDRKTAVEYSFLAAVPVMVAATGYELLGALPELKSDDVAMLIVGFVTAFVAATIAIKFLLKLVQTSNFKIFGWYRIALAAVVLTLTI